MVLVLFTFSSCMVSLKELDNILAVFPIVQR
jgi:hypothetical protein